jgi:hypothetical protein
VFAAEFISVRVCDEGFVDAPVRLLLPRLMMSCGSCSLLRRWFYSRLLLFCRKFLAFEVALQLLVLFQWHRLFVTLPKLSYSVFSESINCGGLCLFGSKGPFMSAVFCHRGLWYVFMFVLAVSSFAVSYLNKCLHIAFFAI